jgi:hypothetical protein
VEMCLRKVSHLVIAVSVACGTSEHSSSPYSRAYVSNPEPQITFIVGGIH